MSCKCPVLLVIDGISRELIELAGCGVYAEPENPNMIAKKAVDLSNMPKSELLKMGVNGYNYAFQNFDRKKLSSKYIELINKSIVAI